MEGSDTFGQGVEIDQGEDPFAGTDFGDFGDAGSTAELKTVDKEGNEVGVEETEESPEPAPAHAPNDGASVESQEGTKPAPESSLRERTAEEREEEARQYREERGEPHPRAFDRGTGEPGPTHMLAGAERPAQAAPDPTSPVASDGPTETTGSVSAGPGDIGHPDGPEGVAREAEDRRREEEGDVALPEDPTPASSGEQGATGEPQSGDEDAEPPAETDSSGKVTKRRYVILQVVGPGKFEQVTWYEDANGKMVPKGPGSKRQGIAAARSRDDALRIGFAAVGAPETGAQLVAVAQLHFEPKKIKPRPPEPSRMKLEIS